MISAREALITARSLLATPEQFTQGTFATTAHGDWIDFTGSKAYCFCADGAVARASGVTLDEEGRWVSDDTPYKEASRALRDATVRLTGDKKASYVAINDGRLTIGTMTAHEAVLKVFDMAIEATPV